jgi:putative CocE/NonD family hydrolase
MPDGCRLAARAWIPARADQDPVPAILEYVPYRKRDGTRMRDEPMHHWFAGHGYAALRVDLRGSGDSEGLLLDEYTEREHLDALEVLRWIAAQVWCNGAIGMMGKSWGGFNALQVAALQPPALKAIVTVCSTDDRYADDVHYMGGCLLNDNMWWGATMLVFNNRPPDPEIVGERWLDMWKERLAADEPWPPIWLRHQRRDAYWQHGSICEDYGAIKVPVYAIGGWSDG